MAVDEIQLDEEATKHHGKIRVKLPIKKGSKIPRIIYTVDHIERRIICRVVVTREPVAARSKTDEREEHMDN